MKASLETRILVGLAVAIGAACFFFWPSGARDAAAGSGTDAHEHLGGVLADGIYSVPARAVVTEPGQAEHANEGHSAHAAPDNSLLPSGHPTTRVTVHGYVVDIAGVRQGGLEVTFLGSQIRRGVRAAQIGGLTGPDGTFELEIPPYDGRLEARGDHLTTVLGSFVGVPPADVEHRIVVGPSMRVAGVVQDRGGVPLGNAEVTVDLRESALGSELASDSSSIPQFVARTDGSGGFSFADVPILEGGELQVFRSGFERESVALTSASDQLLTIRLWPEKPESPVCGNVFFEDGSPCEGARVSLGAKSVLADENGSFCLDLSDSHLMPGEGPLELFALNGDLRSETLELSRDPAEAPTSIVLTLSQLRGKIRGRVVDADGAPRNFLAVDLVEATSFGYVEEPPGSGRYRKSVAEGLAGGVAATMTDPAGRFELRGLESRDYYLEIREPLSLVHMRVGPLTPSEEELEFRFAPLSGFLEGVVVDLEGNPVPGTLVTITRPLTWQGLVMGDSVVSDANGAFRMGPTSVDDAFLRIDGEQVMPILAWPVPAEASSDLTVEVARRFKARVDWSSLPDNVDGIQVHDIDGNPLELLMRDGRTMSLRETLLAGTPAVFAVSQAGAFAVSLVEGVEDARVPIRWDGDGITLVSF